MSLLRSICSSVRCFKRITYRLSPPPLLLHASELSPLGGPAVDNVRRCAGRTAALRRCLHFIHSTENLLEWRLHSARESKREREELRLANAPANEMPHLPSRIDFVTFLQLLLSLLHRFFMASFQFLLLQHLLAVRLLFGFVAESLERVGRRFWLV